MKTHDLKTPTGKSMVSSQTNSVTGSWIYLTQDGNQTRTLTVQESRFGRSVQTYAGYRENQKAIAEKLAIVYENDTGEVYLHVLLSGDENPRDLARKIPLATLEKMIRNMEAMSDCVDAFRTKS